MNFVDIFVLVIMGLFALIGFWKGFVSQIFQAAGIFCAFYFNTPVSNFLADLLSTEPEGIILFLIGIAAFFLIFAVFFIAGLFIGKTIDFILTSLPNRIAGVIFGAVNGFFVVTVVFLVMRSFEKSDEFLKKYVTPDKATDELINKGMEISGTESAGPGKVTGLEYDGSKKTKIYSKLGYGAYRISAMMDPFAENVKDMLKDKTDRSIDEKFREKIEDLKENISE